MLPIKSYHNLLRDFWLDYRSEVLFFFACLITVVLSTWFGQYIPNEVYDNILTPVFNTCTVVASFGGAWLLFNHSEGMRMRKMFAQALVVWGACDLIYLIGWAVAPHQVMDMAAHELTTYELLLGNLLGWVLLLYPTEALRPGWISFRHVLWHLLPMFALVALDYVIPLNLRPLIALYPFALIAFLVSHIKAYQNWCEENFSTLEDIDVQWLIHYLWMVILVGCVYIYMCVAQSPTRGFTQLWLTIFMFVYSTEQILYRRDPWAMVRQREQEKLQEQEEPQVQEARPVSENEDLRRRLDEWMDKEKPFVNPDFQLADLSAVLPMNRTYLSQFIKAEYGCTFYQWVNHYRIEEAKRLKLANPDMKMDELATCCGFSSRNVFSHVFTRETGLSPREWFKKM